MEYRRSYSSLIFLFFLLWLNLRSTESPSDVDEEIGFSQRLTTLNRSITPSLFPKNISDWYKGTWSLATAPTVPIKSMFKHKEGRVSMIFTPTGQPASDILLLKAEVDISDGEYVTSKALRSPGQGIYFASTGALFLVLNAASDVKSLDQTLILPNNVSYTASELWNMQIDSTKFTTNPFTQEERVVRHQWNETDVQTDGESRKGLGLDGCAFMMVAQFETKEESAKGEEKRKWRFGRFLPFDTSEDDMMAMKEEEERMRYRLRGYMASSNCGMMIEIKNDTRSGDLDSLVTSGQWYVGLAILNLMGMSLLVISHVESRSSNAAMMKISAMSLLAPTCYDLVYSLFHLLLGFTYAPLSRLLYFLFFLSFVIISFYQVRYLLDVCKVTWWPGSSHTSNLGRLYAVIYAYIGLAVLILVLYEPLLWVPLVLAHSGWCFQIYHNARHRTRTRSAFSWYFIVGTTVCRLFAPLYFYLLPQHFIHLPRRSSMILGLVAFDFIQLTILLAQDTLGPRFFIPSWLLPSAYNYHRPIPHNILSQAPHDSHQNFVPGPSPSTSSSAHSPPTSPPNAIVSHPICAICMTEVNPFNSEHMIAPCNHVFHEPCLLTWMEQKMECPICRGRLPLPPELDPDYQANNPQPIPPHNAHDMV